MVLRCTCGGVVELDDATYTDEYATESYQCVSCGRTGHLSIGPNGDSKSGCLVENGVY